jgi:O-antigen/teichoic acid export membrane protein
MIFNRTAGAALAVIVSALTARILTPSELGSIVTTLASIGLLMRFASVGLGQSAQFYGARESTEGVHFGRPLLLATIPVTVGSFLALSIAGPFVGKWMLARDFQAQELFRVLQYGIPLSLLHFVASLYILGRREMRLYLWLSQLPVLASVLVLGWGAVAGRGLYAVVWASMAQFGLSFIMGISVFFRRTNHPGAALLPSFKAMYHYGRKSYVVAMAAFAAGRVSLIMGPWFTVTAEVGIFAVGRTFAEALLLIYGAIGPLVFSYVGSMKDSADCHNFISRVCRLSFLLFSGMSVAIALIAPFGIPLVFGEHFRHSYLVVWMLLPGLVFSALQRILENYLYGRAKQTAIVYVHAISVSLLIGSAALLASRFGATGLAMATSISFIGSFIFTASIAFRTDGLNPFLLILPTTADYRFLVQQSRIRGFALWK